MFSDKFKRHKILITSILSVGIIYIFFWEHLTFLPGNVNFSQQLYTTITDIKLANEEQITDKPPDPELLAQKGWKKQQESDDSTNNYPDFFQKSFKVQNSKIITTKTAANTYSDANSDASLDANSLSSSKIIQKSVSSTLKTQKMNNTSINSAESKISGAKSTVAKSTIAKSTVAKTIVEPATVDHAKFPTKPIKILFMTEYRSGSTFISTLLNKHPSIHYMFEPLYLSDNRPQFEYLKHNLTGKQNTIRVQQQILSDYYNECKLPDSQVYLTPEMEEMAKTKNIERHYLYYWCKVEGICFRHKSDKFKSPPFCPVPHPEDGIKASKLHKLCPAMGNKLGLAQTQCDSLEARSTKVIRLKTITDLPENLKFDEDFKIIYLVRDPRGITSSRFNIVDNNWNTEADKKLNGLCSHFHKFIDQRKQNLENSNSGDQLLWNAQVLVIRYEDFALNPIVMADRVYKFLKMNYPDSIKETLQHITHGDKSMLDESRGGEPCTYCTVRESEKIIFKWAQSLDWATVEKVQNNCGKMFETFGYKAFSSEDEYNDARFSDEFNPLEFKNCTTCEF